MSQEKVDKYKAEKANRKKNIKKQKLQNALHKCVIGVIGLALIGWIGYSAYNTYQTNRPVDEIQIDYSAVDELPQERLEIAIAHGAGDEQRFFTLKAIGAQYEEILEGLA